MQNSSIMSHKVHVPDTHNRYSDTKTNRVLDTFIKQSHNLSVKFGAHTCRDCMQVLFLPLSVLHSLIPLPFSHSSPPGADILARLTPLAQGLPFSDLKHNNV